MARKPKCSSGNKRCGGRCIPQEHICGEADADAALKEVSTYKGKDKGIRKKAKNKLNVGRTKNYVKKKEARKRLKAMQEEAYELAGGKKEYERELEDIISDTGAGIQAKIIRQAMGVIAPNLIKADDLNMYLSVKKRGKYEDQVYRPNRKEFKQEDIIRKGDKLQTGDIIRVRFGGPVGGGFGYHYGVYLGNGRVIQYGNMKINESGTANIATKDIGIYETNLKNLNRTGRYKWEKVPGAKSKYSPEELAQRIRKVKDKKIRYNMISNNCEHFAYLLTQGKAYSSQSDSSYGVTGAIVKVVFDYLQMQRRKKTGYKAKEFKRINQLHFSEGVQGPRPIGSSLDDKFKQPRNESDIEKDLQKAIMFASQVEQDPVNQVSVLASWLQEYIMNVSIDLIDE